MRNLALVLVSLAACGGAPKPSSVGNVAGAGAPAGPPPTIGWSGGAPNEGGTFDVHGLPAVSDDGSRVLVGWEQGDGGRGYPNLRLVVLDRGDQTLETRVVLDADQVDDGATVDVAPHDQYLADSNAKLRWRALAPAPVEQVAESEPEAEGPYPTRQTATLGDVTIRFDDGGHLVIEQDGKPVVDKVESGWLVASHPMYDGAGPDEVCSNPIFLDSAWVDAARRLAVVDVEYRGNDSCWEPTGVYHVVTW
ncbi:MAG TPA: hypothetical protein VHE35_14355 [Kofleriaceae bacterium]|nr:hypothetical protein [Kofleriaceae bacterium]